MPERNRYANSPEIFKKNLDKAVRDPRVKKVQVAPGGKETE